MPAAAAAEGPCQLAALRSTAQHPPNSPHRGWGGGGGGAVALVMKVRFLLEGSLGPLRATKLFRVEGPLSLGQGLRGRLPHTYDLRSSGLQKDLLAGALSGHFKWTWGLNQPGIPYLLNLLILQLAWW